MKFEKYLICHMHANKTISERCGIRQLHPSELRVMCALRMLGNATHTRLNKFIQRYHPSKSRVGQKDILRDLAELGLTEHNGQGYQLSPLGRSWLSMYRNFLFNQRLRPDY